ncbi:MAG: hypothetical protein EOP84_04645 [Verrucomicrobiaceae bacterium]|nr:MAG: hypothetical protein EOP84_04645 [Verrucomicrobiaceae bacterium]
MKQYIVIIFLLFRLFAVKVAADFDQRDASINGLMLLRDELYRDGDANLYFRTNRLETNAMRGPANVSLYRDRLNRQGDEDASRAALRDVVDAKSWRRISSSLYVDKLHVYLHILNSSGGILTIVENLKPEFLMFYHVDQWIKVSDIPTFGNNKTMDQWYVCDGERVFHEGIVLKHAHIKTFKVISRVDGVVSGNMAIDASNIYEGEKIISVKQFLEIARGYSERPEREFKEYSTAMHELIKNRDKPGFK